VKRWLGIALLGALGVYWFVRAPAPPKRGSVVAAVQEPGRQASSASLAAATLPRAGANDTPTAAPQPAPVAARAKPDHAAMHALRALFDADPASALEAARTDAERFPDSADAPERSWVIVRALSRLGRFDDARAEASLMVELYPDTPWATDLERHVLANPP